MTADVEQDDLMLADQQGQSNTIGIGRPDGMASGKFAGELMKPEARLKRVLLQSADSRSEAGLRSGCFLNNLLACRRNFSDVVTLNTLTLRQGQAPSTVHQQR